MTNADRDTAAGGARGDGHSAGSGARALHHAAVFYRDREGYLAATVPFVQAALTSGEPLLLALPRAGLDLLCRHFDGLLGPTGTPDRADGSHQVDGSGPVLQDLEVAGRNPGRIIPGVLLPMVKEHPGEKVHVICEPIWPGRSELERLTAMTSEAVINVALADRDAHILCLYHAAQLDVATLKGAAQTHPVLGQDQRRWPSSRYTDPLQMAARLDHPLPPRPPGAATMGFRSRTALAEVRQFARRHAAASLVPGDRVDDFVTAVNELAANALEHTDGPGELAIWKEPGLLVCQVDDSGRFADLLPGYLPPPADGESGRGLLLANELCDLVRVHRGFAGTSVRLHIGLRNPTRHARSTDRPRRARRPPDRL